MFHCPVAELEQRLGWDELIEWVMAYSLEPWGEGFEDANHAWTRSVIVNVNKTKGKPSKATDFLMKRRSSKIGRKEMTAAELKASFDQWAAVSQNPKIKWEDNDGSRQT